ncbi:hypothetical protein Ahy_B04g071120 [Arachis hypogaea]|uniref:FAR1 domain-containing protein n=1 Tax=Arachis hypogaea TaxID=3818 RepID=A0A444ZK26_ARAHY|nr:hypothetical protein Ahy_B04g071120 [Arachis hypogaea]
MVGSNVVCRKASGVCSVQKRKSLISNGHCRQSSGSLGQHNFANRFAQWRILKTLQDMFFDTGIEEDVAGTEARGQSETVVDSSHGYGHITVEEGFKQRKWLEKFDMKQEHKPVTKCGCLAEIRIKWNAANGKWCVGRFLDDHNHTLLPERFVGGFNLVRFTKQDMHNVVRKQRALQNRDVNVALRFFQRAARDDERQFWRYQSRFIQLFKQCMLADVEVAEFEMQWEAMIDKCGVKEVEWIEKSAAAHYKRDMFYRFCECLKRTVRYYIMDREEGDYGCCYVIQKYGRPEETWQIAHVAILVGLDMGALLHSLLLGRWCKVAKSHMPRNRVVSDTGYVAFQYHRRVGVFVDQCKRLAKVAYLREEDFKAFLEKMLTDTALLEVRMGCGWGWAQILSHKL